MDLSPLLPEMNVAKALERLCGDEMLLLELVSSLTLECREAEAKLTQDADQQHFTELQAQAHYYQGIAANLELTHLYNSVLALEENARLGNAKKCQQAVAAMLACNRRVEALLAQLQQSS